MLHSLQNVHNIGFFVAYLDPGSGSYVLQFVVASLLGLAFVTRNFWRNVKNSVVKIFLKPRENAESDD